VYKAGFPTRSLTRAQIGNYRAIVVAVAIGMAESECNPGGVNSGAIWQYQCSHAGVYKEWYARQASPSLNPVLQNAGTGLCLDAQDG
jgi:hypothetical protein